jgi:hypothetical protein
MTSTTQLPLNAQAQAMLRSFHRQAGIVPSTVEHSIAQQANQNVQAGGTAATNQTASFKGYTMVVGFTDVHGTWKEQSRTVNSDASKHESFSFDIDAFNEPQKNNGNLEVRLFNADSVPAMRVLVPFREIRWGT